MNTDRPQVTAPARTYMRVKDLVALLHEHARDDDRVMVFDVDGDELNLADVRRSLQHGCVQFVVEEV